MDTLTEVFENSTLETTMGDLNVPELTSLYRLAFDGHPPKRKQELVDALEKILSTEERLKKIYDGLTDLERFAVQEAVAHTGPVDWEGFEAKYGARPEINLPGGIWDRDKKAAPLRLFLTKNSMVADDLRHRLSAFVPTPRVLEVQSSSELPARVPMAGIGDHAEASLEVHLTEQAALHDVVVCLRLAQGSGIGASEQTGRVSESGSRAIREILLDGDFYPAELEAKSSYDIQMGQTGIRPFAWPLLLQAGGLAKVTNGKLRLTKSGEAALSRPAEIILQGLWNNWLGNDLLHELNRIEVIKGQKSRRHPLADAEPARELIVEALADLTPGAWTSIDDFFKFISGTGRRFSSTRDNWPLYIAEPEYGSLGYDHIRWRHIDGRFTLAFLLEYTATLGIIDVALTPPWGTPDDFSDLWGTDDLSCLSRYDGLRYIRLNPLGAWILSKTSAYTPSPELRQSLFRVLDNLEVTFLKPHVGGGDRLFLDRISEKVSERVWRLSKDKILKAVEGGLTLEEIERYLASGHEASALPITVLTLLSDSRRVVSAVHWTGEACLVECMDEAHAIMISSDLKLKSLCLLTGKIHLVILRENLEAFRRIVRERNYGVLPKV